MMKMKKNFILQLQVFIFNSQLNFKDTGQYANSRNPKMRTKQISDPQGIFSYKNGKTGEKKDKSIGKHKKTEEKKLEDKIADRPKPIFGNSKINKNKGEFIKIEKSLKEELNRMTGGDFKGEEKASEAKLQNSEETKARKTETQSSKHKSSGPQREKGKKKSRKEQEKPSDKATSLRNAETSEKTIKKENKQSKLILSDTLTEELLNTPTEEEPKHSLKNKEQTSQEQLKPTSTSTTITGSITSSSTSSRKQNERRSEYAKQPVDNEQPDTTSIDTGKANKNNTLPTVPEEKYAAPNNQIPHSAVSPPFERTRIHNTSPAAIRHKESIDAMDLESRLFSPGAFTDVIYI